MVALERKSPAEATFADLKFHFGDVRPNTQLAVTESLRKNYPQYHVTVCSSVCDCDLLGYAQDGHAETSPVLVDELSDFTRNYNTPKRRTEPGSLRNSFSFGQHKYRWHGVDFILFELAFQKTPFRDEHLIYILAPRDSGEIVNGLHSITDALILEAGSWTRVLHNEVYVFDDARWVKNKELWEAVNGSSWDDVILSPKTKQNLIDDVHSFFDNRDLYREFAVPWKRGIILHGQPGNGKTLSIRALMSSLSNRPDSIPTLYVKSLRSCEGPQYSVRRIFTRARATAPCLLILEDLDSLINKNVRSYFLNEVDGLESNDGILMIGSTNHLDKLDPAISKRPSRFDRKYLFDLPGDAERTSYCHYWKQKLAKNDRVAFPDMLCPIIAKLTAGFTFAYMKELFVASLLVVARGGTGETEMETRVTATKVTEEAEKATQTATGTSQGEAVDKTIDETKSAPKQPRVLPHVDVPESLQDNVLLKVFIQQATILLTEMDSTKPEDWKSSASKFGRVDDDYDYDDDHDSD